MTQRSIAIARVIYTLGSWTVAACGSDTNEPLRTVQDAPVVTTSAQLAPEISSSPSAPAPPEAVVVTPQIQTPTPDLESTPTPDAHLTATQTPTPEPSIPIKPVLPAQADATPQCQRGSLESDLLEFPLDGAGVSGGALKPGQYVLSSTYLRLKDGDAAGSKFWALMGPMLEDLSKRDGLVALGLGLSFECNSARTLSVWRDDVAMMEFVVGAPHSAAVAAISELSRGGGAVLHWAGDETQATWKVAAQKLAEYDAPPL